ncbi:MAG TPA: VCBS repeat-containing protein [Opitutus sp.]|nr:VCBS repeat-containing protein [Opitutus sp.]
MSSRPNALGPIAVLGLMVLLLALLGGAVAWLSPVVAPRATSVRSTADLPPAVAPAFDPVPIGKALEGHPWIPHLAVADLDRDGRPDLLACDAQFDAVEWLRRNDDGTFTETTLARGIKAPVHASVCDYDGDGDPDILVASMGEIFPNNDKIGSVVVLVNDGTNHFTARFVREHIARVTDVRGADVDGDGDIDLIVGQFGYVQGGIMLLRNRGDQTYADEQLLDLSGTIHTPVADFDGDGRPDVAALVSQEWEEVHLFDNDAGNLRDRTVWGSVNEDYGSSGLEVADLDRDGDMDLLYTNGDAFDYSRPGPRPWHGVQWLENKRGNFIFHRLGDQPGAYSPIAVDIDNDHDLDLVATCGFGDWTDPATPSLVVWINDGAQHFTPVVLAHAPTHLITVVAADFDGDGRVDLATGTMYAYPPWDQPSRITLWRQRP